MLKQDSHIFTGMQRDSAISKQKAEYLWDAHNIRLTAREGDTLFAMTNEKGTSQVVDGSNNQITMNGSYLGHCVLNNYLTVFTKDNNYDYIYRIEKGNPFNITQLFKGDLKFELSHPIETLGIYENELIQKVYWVDGINQPRVINIIKDKLDNAVVNYNNNSFDFIKSLELNDVLHIYKEASNTGLFPAGVIQYAITYYNKYGQESNISQVSPLLSTSYPERAGSPEEKMGNAFRIVINNPDRNFDYIRIYSIFRTSIDATPTVKIVKDILISDISSQTPSGGGVYMPYGNVQHIPSTLFMKKAPMTRVPLSPDLAYYNIRSIEFYDGNKPLGKITSTDLDTDERGCNNELPRLLPKVAKVSGSFKTDTATIEADFWKINKSDYPNLIFRFNRRTYAFGDADYILIGIKDTITQGDGILTFHFPIMGKNNSNVDADMLISDTGSFSLAENAALVYTDNNEGGEAIDPTVLLYVGGESIIANTLTQKDGTLFFGNIQISRSSIPSSIKEAIKGNLITFNTRSLYLTSIGGSNYRYANTLTATTPERYSDNPAGFMKDEHYKFGVQFQHSNGKWSEPVLIGNATNTVSPSIDLQGDIAVLNVPQATCVLNNLDTTILLKLGYKKARGVVVLPSLQDRIVVAKGMLCPTVYNIVDRINNAPYVQSSWFLRPFPGSGKDSIDNISNGATAQYHHYKSLFGGDSRASEIQGVPQELSDIYIGEYGNQVSNKGAKGASSPSGSIYIKDGYSDEDENYQLIDRKNWGNIYGVDQSIVTMHSPDIEFDDNFASLNYSQFNFNIVGRIPFNSSFGDIDISTSSPPIASESGGFQHRTMSSTNTFAAKSLLSGLFYEDFLVDENKDADKYTKYSSEKYPWLYMIYPWHKSGSLNNDAIRPANAGARSAVLKRKVISNIKFSNNNDWKDKKGIRISKIQLFNSDQVTTLKLDDKVYYGNIDTMAIPMKAYGNIFATGGSTPSVGILNSTLWNFNLRPSFTDTQLYFNTQWGLYPYPVSHEQWYDRQAESVGKEDPKLRVTRESIRIKYKTTPHVMFSLTDSDLETIYNSMFTAGYPSLLIGELTRDNTSNFENNSEANLKNCLWLSAGDSVPITPNMAITFKYGDTYYQRYDCLKTYPFSLEDPNSIVEIGSFMCETRINIDGRYDKNRGNISNLNILNTNFNKINPVYTQKDNFFNYRVLDNDYYKIDKYPTSVTWTKTKASASDVDTWTNITLANILDLEGDKGEVTSLNTYNDNIFCFQQQGISNILFNSRVQIPTSDGVPVEISNNYKVDGKRYLSGDLGCVNKWSIQVTSSGIYFIESTTKALYHLSEKGLIAISDSHGMDNFFNTFSESNVIWRANEWRGVKTFYDKNYSDLYISNASTSINFSDTLGQFISFFDYGGIPGMFNIGNEFYAIKNDGSTCSLWRMFNGEYNNFFGELKPYDFTFVSNSNEAGDKIFTNLMLRADFYQDGVDKVVGSGGSVTYTPYKNRLNNKLFFDYVQAYNECQSAGKVPLTFKNAKPSNLKKKFRLWALDIPRDKHNRLDRIRNNWTYIKLGNNTVQPNATDVEKANSSLGSNKHMILHDVTVGFHI